MKKRSALEVATKPLLSASFAIIGPSDVSDDDERKVLLVGSRLPPRECPTVIVRAFAGRQSYVEFISYVYMSPDGLIDIETTNASFNRRSDLKRDVELALKELHDEHVKKLLAVFKKAKIASRVRSTVPAAVPLQCDSTYYLRASLDGGKVGFVQCGRHRGHDDDHRSVYREGDGPGMFGDGRGLVWGNAGPRWIVASLVPKKTRASVKKVKSVAAKGSPS